LSGANADFPYICSDLSHSDHAGESPTAPAIGSRACAPGRSCSGRGKPGVRASLKRNPNYHKEGKPYFDEVEFLSIADVAARTNALNAARSTGSAAPT